MVVNRSDRRYVRFRSSFGNPSPSATVYLSDRPAVRNCRIAPCGTGHRLECDTGESSESHQRARERTLRSDSTHGDVRCRQRHHTEVHALLCCRARPEGSHSRGRGCLRRLYRSPGALPFGEGHTGHAIGPIAGTGARHQEQFSAGHRTRLGERVARAILAWRETDGFSATVEPFFGKQERGQWRPVIPNEDMPSVLPQLNRMTPFALRSPTQFRPDPPPARRQSAVRGGVAGSPHLWRDEQHGTHRGADRDGPVP